MIFTAPLFLLALLPWAAVTLWLLWGRHRQVNVPFLPLWLGPIATPKAKRALQIPPLGLACAILATLATLLAASGPRLSAIPSDTADLSIIVDRGQRMSAHAKTDLLFRQLGANAASEISSAFAPHQRLRLIFIPATDAPADVTASQFPAAIANVPPTAIDTTTAMPAAVSAELAASHQVIAITDRDLGPPNPRLVRISPQDPISNISIMLLAARQHPQPQAMVRIRNESSPATTATLRLNFDGQEKSHPIDLPAPSTTRDYFLDLPNSGQGSILTAQLDIKDDLPSDNFASLVRQRSWPRLEPRIAVSPELQRMIDVYTYLRHPSEISTTVAILEDAKLARGPALILPRETPAAAPTTSPATLNITAHPITANVTFPKNIRPASAAPSSDGWTPIVTAASPLVMVRQTPEGRQAWVSLTSPDFPSTPHYVMFWTNLFDWLGEGGAEFASQSTHLLGPQWRRVAGPTPDPAAPASPASSELGLVPGLYHHPDGRTIALNAPDVSTPSTIPDPNWPSHLRQLAAQSPTHNRAGSLRSPLLLAAMSLMLLAALTWRQERKSLASKTPRADDSLSRSLE